MLDPGRKRKRGGGPSKEEMAEMIVKKAKERLQNQKLQVSRRRRRRY